MFVYSHIHVLWIRKPHIQAYWANAGGYCERSWIPQKEDEPRAIFWWWERRAWWRRWRRPAWIGQKHCESDLLEEETLLCELLLYRCILHDQAWVLLLYYIWNQYYSIPDHLCRSWHHYWVDIDKTNHGWSSNDCSFTFVSDLILANDVYHCRVFTSLEFIMTMGANDFQQFIFSYFAEIGLTIVMRTYVGPLVEKLELLTQKIAIYLSQKSMFVQNLTRNILKRELK